MKGFPAGLSASVPAPPGVRQSVADASMVSVAGAGFRPKGTRARRGLRRAARQNERGQATFVLLFAGWSGRSERGAKGDRLVCSCFLPGGGVAWGDAKNSESGFERAVVPCAQTGQRAAGGVSRRRGLRGVPAASRRGRAANVRGAGFSRRPCDEASSAAARWASRRGPGASPTRGLERPSAPAAARERRRKPKGLHKSSLSPCVPTMS